MSRRSQADTASTGRRVGRVLLGLVLALTLVSANLVVGAQRTALDADFVTETVAEEDGYEALRDELRTVATESVRESAGEVSGVDVEGIVAESLTTPYVREQVDANVDGLYAFLHGDSDELALGVDVVPVKDRIAAAAAETVANYSTGELLAASGADLPDELSPEDIDRMVESERAFQVAQQRFPDGTYEEIQALEGETPVERAGIAYAETVAEELATDSTDHDTFRENVAAARAELESAVADTVRARLDEQLPDRLSLTDELSGDARGQLADAASGVSLLDTLQFVLPVLAVALAGALYALTRSVPSVAYTAGWGLLAAGVLAYGSVTLAGGRARGALADAAGSATGPAVVGFDVADALVAGTVGTVAAQSLVLAVVGLVLFGGALAARRGMFDAAGR